MSAADTPFQLAGRRVWVAGHRGMVGSAIVRRLAEEDCTVLTAGRGELDLCRQDEVERWMKANRPEVVFLAAAKVGGIHANSTRPAEFLYENLVIEANVVHTAWQLGVEKLLLMGSSCIYPRHAQQPMAEAALLTGPLEPTNEAYAVAKIAGIKLCQAYRFQYGCDFISAMPTNLYGPGDNYDLNQGHAVAALIRKAHEAKVNGPNALDIWGDGTPLREFLCVDDLADALIFLLNNYSGDEHVNVGTGRGHTIRQLAETVAEVVGFGGEFRFDLSKPNGMPVKIMDVSRLTSLGWKARISLKDGLAQAYAWFLANEAGNA